MIKLLIFFLLIALGFAQFDGQDVPSLIIENGTVTFNLCLGCDLMVGRKVNMTGTIVSTVDSLISVSQVQSLFVQYLTPINAQLSSMSASITRAQATEASLGTQLQIEQSRAMSAEMALQATIQALPFPTINSGLASLSTSIAVEASRAISSSAIISQALASEVTRAMAAESSVSAAVAVERTRATSTEASVAVVSGGMVLVQTSLAQSVGVEKSRAGSVEGSLGTSIGLEAARAMGVEASINTGLVSEKSRAVYAEGSLGTSLNAEIIRATGIDGSLGSSAVSVLLVLTADVSRAVGLDAGFQSNLAAEVTRATGAEASVAGQVAAERTRAVLAEVSLALMVNAETARALASEASVGAAAAAALAGERARALGSEASLAVSAAAGTAAERARALAAEGAEVTRATGVESSLSVSVAAVSIGLSNEVVRATGVEGSVAVSVAVERSRSIASLCNVGLTQNNPAISCVQILRSGCPYATTSGVYWINYNFVPTRTFCDQVSYGGGWELIMKMAAGTTFSYTSAYWSTLNTLNPASNLDATYGTDNKYSGYNYGQYNQVLARFSFSGTQWDWPITGMNVVTGGVMTPITYFNQGALFFGNQVNTGYFTNGGTKWSAQGGYQNFGVNNCCNSYSCVRFGFIWNNEADCASNDVSSGIGLTSTYRSYSVGDVINCCPTVTGANAAFNGQLWARIN